jgi:hypothetical protein
MATICTRPATVFGFNRATGAAIAKHEKEKECYYNFLISKELNLKKYFFPKGMRT